MTKPEGAGGGRGQDKQHTIRNPTTGEERQITQREWREQGKALREQGFQRPDDLPDDTAEQP